MKDNQNCWKGFVSAAGFCFKTRKERSCRMKGRNHGMGKQSVNSVSEEPWQLEVELLHGAGEGRPQMSAVKPGSSNRGRRLPRRRAPGHRHGEDRRICKPRPSGSREAWTSLQKAYTPQLS